jgi:hypothetical protein
MSASISLNGRGGLRVHPLDQRPKGHFEGGGNLGEGTEGRGLEAAFNLGNVSAVEAGAGGQLFLGDSFFGSGFPERIGKTVHQGLGFG